ncbi:sulfurtransferase [Massilia sp. W12]|uniref:sulfurtransferase n=1 Tax=Massilia sp. W12 TaxID=3126507 RepID=UPI0030CC2F93
MYKTLISAADLHAMLDHPQLVIVDCRHDLMDSQAGQRAYAAGHLPGAHFMHLDHSLSGDKQRPDGVFAGRHPLPTREALIAALRAIGVNDDSQVVAYDAQGGMFAARLWWLLRWLGHDKVAVLDGGLPAWQAAGHGLSQEAPAPQQGRIGARAALTASVDVQDVLANLQSRARTVVDARAPDRFRGENETIDPVGGHIPGALNRFFKDNLQADGRFKDSAALRAEWQALGVGDAAHQFIMQCGSGVTACHNLLALEIAGLPGAALYPGSWSEWCADPARPLER